MSGRANYDYENGIGEPPFKVYNKSSELMADMPDCSVHLTITSPPYNVDKDYEKGMSFEDYRKLLVTVWSEVYYKTVMGGRVCINVANTGRKPYIPLHKYIIDDMTEIGFLMRGEIIWNKGASVGSSTAWGTWKDARNPTLRDVHEYILVFSKGEYGRQQKTSKPLESTIHKDDFLECTKSIWSFKTENAQGIGHPAPFPVELPYRLIQLYSFKDDVVLDPFCGSGTTGVAAIMSNRRFRGYETYLEYVKLAESRINDAQYTNDFLKQI